MTREKTEEEKMIEKRHKDAREKIIAKVAEIVDNGVDAMTPADIEYIRARRSYLNPMQAQIVEVVLADKKPSRKKDASDDE